MTTFTLNGRTTTLDAEPATPVLWALRDQLGAEDSDSHAGIPRHQRHAAALSAANCAKLRGARPVTCCTAGLTSAAQPLTMTWFRLDRTPTVQSSMPICFIEATAASSGTGT